MMLRGTQTILGDETVGIALRQTLDGFPSVLVAFSGEVNDPDTGPEPFSETSMNPGLRGRDIREAFRGTEFSILIVANKFQTGFDQPLLCAMYVDRKLGGIQAVQTLSRLNRSHAGKDTTYVVDEDTSLTAYVTRQSWLRELTDVLRSPTTASPPPLSPRASRC